MANARGGDVPFTPAVPLPPVPVVGPFRAATVSGGHLVPVLPGGALFFAQAAGPVQGVQKPDPAAIAEKLKLLAEQQEKLKAVQKKIEESRRGAAPGEKPKAEAGRLVITEAWTQLVESDVEFLNRVTTAARGEPPTALEVKYFTEDKDPRKREKLIDTLLKEPAVAKKLGDDFKKRMLAAPRREPRS